jgi:hypothetical protein
MPERFRLARRKAADRAWQPTTLCVGYGQGRFRQRQSAYLVGTDNKHQELGLRMAGISSAKPMMIKINGQNWPRSM